MENVFFESDSASLLHYINGSPGLFFPMLRQIWNLRHRFVSFKWCWIPHQANSAADWVASHCRRGMCSEVWVTKLPSALVHILSIDGLRCPHSFLLWVAWFSGVVTQLAVVFLATLNFFVSLGFSVLHLAVESWLWPLSLFRLCILFFVMQLSLR